MGSNKIEKVHVALAEITSFFVIEKTDISYGFAILHEIGTQTVIDSLFRIYFAEYLGVESIIFRHHIGVAKGCGFRKEAPSSEVRIIVECAAEKLIHEFGLLAAANTAFKYYGAARVLRSLEEHGLICLN